MKKIKICFVETACKKNGPIKQTLNIIQYMDRTVFDPILLTLWEEDPNNSMLSEYKVQNIPVICANLTKFETLFLGRNKVTKILKDINPDIVQGVGMPPYRTTLGYKDVVHFITLRNYCYDDYPDYYGKIKGPIMAFCDMKLIRKRINKEPIITCSKSLSSLYKSKQKLDIPYIRNGVNVEKYSKRDLKKISDIRKKLGLPLNKTIFIYGGFFIERKNQKECIEGFIKSNACENGILLLLGDGKEREALISKYYNYSQIKFLGQVDNIEEYLHASDVYISSSKSEGLPNGVLEAMACGLPLLISNIVQHTEIIELNEKCGLTYQLGNTDDLKEKINLMLIQDLIAMGNESNKVVIQDLSAEIMSKKYQDIYREIIKKGYDR